MTENKCSFCDGTGKDGYHKEEECQSCDGTGKLKISSKKKKK